MDTARSRDASGQPSRAKGVYRFDFSASSNPEYASVALSDLVLQQERELTWAPPPLKPNPRVAEARSSVLSEGAAGEGAHVGPAAPPSPEQRFAALYKPAAHTRARKPGPIVYVGGPSSDLDVYLEHRARRSSSAVRLPGLGAAARPAAPPDLQTGVSIRELIAARLAAEQAQRGGPTHDDASASGGAAEVLIESLRRRIARASPHTPPAARQDAPSEQTSPLSLPSRRPSQLSASVAPLAKPAATSSAQLPLSHPAVTRQAVAVQRTLAKSALHPQSLLPEPQFQEEAAALAAVRNPLPAALASAKKARQRIALPSPATAAASPGTKAPAVEHAASQQPGAGVSQQLLQPASPPADDHSVGAAVAASETEPLATRARAGSIAPARSTLRSAASFSSTGGGGTGVISLAASPGGEPGARGGGSGAPKRSVTIAPPHGQAGGRATAEEDADALLGEQVDRILDLGFKMRATRALRQPVRVDGVLSIVRRCAGLPEEDDDAYWQHIASVEKSTAAPVEEKDDNEDPLAVKHTRGEKLTRVALDVATGIRLDDDTAMRLVDALDPHERQQLMSLSLRAQLRDVLEGDPVFSRSAAPREDMNSTRGPAPTSSTGADGGGGLDVTAAAPRTPPQATASSGKDECGAFSELGLSGTGAPQSPPPCEQHAVQQQQQQLMVVINGQSVPAESLLRPGKAARTLQLLQKEHRHVFAMGAAGPAAAAPTCASQAAVASQAELRALAPGAFGVLQANAASTLAPPPALAEPAAAREAVGAFLRGGVAGTRASSSGGLRFSASAERLEPRVVPRHTGRGSIFSPPFGVRPPHHPSLTASASFANSSAPAQDPVSSPRRRPNPF